MTRRSIFLFLLTVICLASAAAQDQGKIFFDVKSKWAEKAKLYHIKIGTEILLLKSEWASVTEIGAEYALWIRNFKKIENGSSVTIELDIEIRQPAGFTEGKLLANEHIECSFDLDNELKRPKDHIELFRQKLKNVSTSVLLEANVVSEHIYMRIMELVKKLN